MHLLEVLLGQKPWVAVVPVGAVDDGRGVCRDVRAEGRLVHCSSVGVVILAVEGRALAMCDVILGLDHTAEEVTAVRRERCKLARVHPLVRQQFENLLRPARRFAVGGEHDHQRR